MTSEAGFAPAHDAPIPYLERTRTYYQTLGHGAPYEWAHHAEVPFQPLAKPLAECRVALITTAAPYQPDKGNQGPGAPYNAAAKFYRVYSGDTAGEHDLRISHLAIDRAHTTAEDPRTYFPLEALRSAAASGRIGALARRFHGAPTNRSQRTTLEVDVPELVARCNADRADAVILVPNCPFCHQTLSQHPRRVPRCNRPCAGTTVPTGSSTTATWTASRPRRSRSGARRSTRARRWRGSCGNARVCRHTIRLPARRRRPISFGRAGKRASAASRAQSTPGEYR